MPPAAERRSLGAKTVGRVNSTLYAGNPAYSILPYGRRLVGDADIGWSCCLGLTALRGAEDGQRGAEDGQRSCGKRGAVWSDG